jgi:hypothetical protein
MRNKILLICFIISLLMVFGYARDMETPLGFHKPGVLGEVVRMNINNIDLPLNNQGSVGEDGQSWYPNGQTTLSFLFSGGFACTGYVNGELRASWMAPASLIEEWQPGKWGMDPTADEAKFYVVSAADGPGSAAYKEWAKAVELGADFHDLDGNGIYDPNIDEPDMLGDKIIWEALNDGTSSTQRTPRLGTLPLGIEIHQQAWAFARADALGDVIFFRYRFINVNDYDIQDLIFSQWEDPDLGDAYDDLIGCDTTLSMGFVYNDADDANYGPNPPAHGVDFFQGPVVDSPGDTAYLYRGPYFGIDTLYDMKNLPMTSFMFYIQSDAKIGDPDVAQVARNYQEGGLDRTGNPLIPSEWGSGGTENTDPRYIFSGDPITEEGWLDDNPADKRFMVNCGPFQLAAHDTQDVVVSYMVAQGSDALNSLEKLKETDVVAQNAYNANFFIAGPPPAPVVTARVFDEKIELIIDLEKNGTGRYDVTDKLLNRQVFEALKVYQLKSNNPSDVVNNIENAKIIKRYDLADKYGPLYMHMSNGTIQKVWDGYNNIDSTSFADPGSAIIKLDITTDAFNNDNPLIPNQEYYFAVTALSLNHTFAEPYEVTPATNDWILSGPADFLESNRQAGFISVTTRSAEFEPFRSESAIYTGGRTLPDQFIMDSDSIDIYKGSVYVDVVNRNEVTGHEYVVDFYNDGNLWKLTDKTTGAAKLDSMTYQAPSPNDWTFPIFDGISAKIVTVTDELDTALVVADQPSDVWLQSPDKGMKAFYYGEHAVYDRSIDLVKHELNRLPSDLESNIRKDEYFPVRVEFDTTNVAQGFSYIGNYTILRGVRDVFVRAFDISDPSNERQLNIAWNSPTGDLNFNTNTQVIIMTSDYDPTYGYTGRPNQDSLFQADAYIIMRIVPVADSLVKSAKFSLVLVPKYPNSDLDQFTFGTANLVEKLTVQDRKGLLDQVKVVPNPYFAYSTYEVSYDQPRLKFTHLDNKATIRIFNLAGNLVRTIEKNSPSNEIYWDLKNEAGLKVASGMYIAHVEVPGVGQKIIKFAVIQREERIDRY